MRGRGKDRGVATVRTRVRRLHHRQDKPIPHRDQGGARAIRIRIHHEQEARRRWPTRTDRPRGGARRVRRRPRVLVAVGATGHRRPSRRPRRRRRRSRRSRRASAAASSTSSARPKSDRITLRLKPGNKSRLQVDVGANGSAEFTFKRSAFNRIVVHGAAGADALSINESFGVFTNTRGDEPLR